MLSSNVSFLICKKLKAKQFYRPVITLLLSVLPKQCLKPSAWFSKICYSTPIHSWKWAAPVSLPLTNFSLSICCYYGVTKLKFIKSGSTPVTLGPHQISWKWNCSNVEMGKTHTHTHTRHTHTHTNTYTHIHTHAHKHTHIHTHIHTSTHTHIHTHTHTHAHTYTHIHTHTHTHTHTHNIAILKAYFIPSMKVGQKFLNSYLDFFPSDYFFEDGLVPCHWHRCCSFVLLSDDRFHWWYFSCSADEEILQHILVAEVSLPRTQVPYTYLILSQMNPVHSFILYNFRSLCPLLPSASTSKIVCPIHAF
jgi:hypothetical protein